MMTATPSSLMVFATVLSAADAAFVAPSARPGVGLVTRSTQTAGGRLHSSKLSARNVDDEPKMTNLFSLSQKLKDPTQKSQLEKNVATLFTSLGFSAMFLTNPLLPHLPYSQDYAAARAEDELYAKYGGKGLQTQLIDKDCIVNKCSLQAKACLEDDPECRKGLTCTAKCLGDNSCTLGCFARYGGPNLEGLLKCTIEDNECIKVAILPGGADKPGEEPKSPAPTVRGFDMGSMEGSWYKVVGYNPNYDCFPCQRNTFSSPEGGFVDDVNERLGNGNLHLPTGGLLGRVGADRLQMDVELSMPHILDDGSPPPPSGVREDFNGEAGLQSVGYNQYATHETMVFDKDAGMGERAVDLLLGKSGEEKLYSRTAHAEGYSWGLSEYHAIE